MSSGYVTKQDRMVSGNNVVPWMGRTAFVTVKPGLLTAKEVMADGGLNFTVKKVPVYYNPEAACVAALTRQVRETQNKEQREALELALNRLLISLPESAQVKSVPDAFAIVREDTGEAIGSVGARYEPIQNSHGLDILDPVIGKSAAYETAGSLFGGRVVWLLAKVEKEWSVTGNDTFKTYLLVYLSHDGTKPLTVRFVTVRVVCANTLAAAVGGLKADVTIRHTRNFADKVEEAHRVLKLADKHQQEFRKAMQALAKKDMNEDKARAFLRSLIPAKDEKKVPTRTENTREDIYSLFAKGTGNEGKTRYDMLNGVTEFVDHKRGTRLHGVGAVDGESDAGKALLASRGAEQRFEATQFGSGAALKAQAFELLSAN